MPISLTEKAATEVKRILDDQKDMLPENPVVRVGVVGGGCSGFQYDFRFSDLNEVDEKVDTRFEQHGVTLVVDKKSDLFLDGTVVDFFESLERRGFHFNNPNAVKSCGCGSSFQA